MSDQEESVAQAELAHMKQRIAELEQALSASEQRERELRENEACWQRMFDEGEDAGWAWNISTGESYLSPSWFNILGYDSSKSAPSMETWTQLLHPEDAPLVIAALNDYMEGRTPTYDLENRMLHKSGRVLWMRSRGTVVSRDEYGRPLRMIGTLTDVTRRREAEEELRRSQALLHAVIENSPAVIYIRDLEYRFLLVNKVYTTILKTEVEQIIGKVDEELFPPEVVKAFRVIDHAVQASGQPVRAEEAAPVDGQIRMFLSYKFPLYDANGKLFAIGGISTDITDRKRAEEERVSLQERVIEAQQTALRALSTPLIPIADDVVVMPLIGTIDSQRAQQLTETMLEGVAAHHASTVILDVTGVEIVDTHVANALVRASRAVRLLGAEVVLTGVRPHVARTLVDMDADLGSIVLHGTLQNGIVYAMRRHGATRG